MTNIFLTFSFILGAIIGSFLNVVSLRYNTGLTLGGRSKCFSCGKNLDWYELIPVFSFLFQKGKCRKCKSKISWQYPVVEIVAGIIFLMIFYVYPPINLHTSIETMFYIFITCILLVITIYDIKHKIIPDSFSYTFTFLAFLHLFILSDLSFRIPSIIELLSGPILALPFILLWALSKGKWMGLGDGKLVIGIGYILGLNGGISAVTLAFWIGAVVSVVWMYISFKKIKEKYEIPFGPYLILGMYLVLLFKINVIDITPILEYFNL